MITITHGLNARQFRASLKLNIDTDGLAVAFVDRAAAQQNKILNCQRAKDNAAANGGGFGAGFVNAMNVNNACN